LLGVLLATVLVAGMYLALQSRGRAGMLDVLRAYAVPFSLLVGAVAFFLVTGLERANPALEGIGPAVARRSRYLYVGAALSLPAIAVAVEQLKTRSRALAVAALVVLVAGVPGNVHRLDEFHRAGEYGMYRRDVLAFARTPITDSVPADTLVRLANVQGMTIGWLRHAVASHELPAPAHMKPKVVASATMRLALGRAIFPAAGCRPLRTPAAVTIRNDQIISVRSGAATVHYVSRVDGGVAAPFSITPSTPVRARVGGLRVQLVPAGTGTVACGLSR
jgi:hypothetical protein